METTELCMGCMEPRGSAEVCPNCGWREDQAPDSPLYLRQRTLLQEQYLVGRVLGHGGFGITYLGWDVNLALKLAVKEYLPSNVATRAPGSSKVTAYTSRTTQDYQWGLEKFLDEARVLARFQNHPGIVSVLNFFRANDTAYLVMEYLEGMTFAEYLAQHGGRISGDQAIEILTPVMNALCEVHKAGILHRDISPDNVHIGGPGKVKLLDFGAARYALGQQSKNLSVILKEGFAPEEQYRSKGVQGPWTDVYAVAATLYKAVTGTTPIPALDRLETDELARPSTLPGVVISAQQEAALMKGLAVRAADRYQSMEDFQAGLAGAPVENKTRLIAPVLEKEATPLPTPLPPAPAPRKSPALIWAVAALGVAAIAGGGYLATRKSAPSAVAQAPASTPATTPPATTPPVPASTPAADTNPPASEPAASTAPPQSAPAPPGAPAPQNPAPDPKRRVVPAQPKAAAEQQPAVAHDTTPDALPPATPNPAVEPPGGRPPATKPPPGDRSVRPAPALSWNVVHDHAGFKSAIKGIAPFGRPRSAPGEPCSGRLSIAGSHIRFHSATADDSFDVPLNMIQEVRLNRFTGGRHAFHIRFQSGENYNFIPQSDAGEVVDAILGAKSRQ
jgi:serine/threonine protein kinase